MIGRTLPGDGLKFAIRPEAIHAQAMEGDVRLSGVVKQSLITGNVIRTTFEGECMFTTEQLHQRGQMFEVGKNMSAMWQRKM